MLALRTVTTAACYLILLLLGGCRQVSDFPYKEKIAAAEWSMRWGDSPKDNAGNYSWLGETSGNENWNATSAQTFQRPSGETRLWLRATLPSSEVPNAIFIAFVDQALEVYTDGTKIFEWGNTREDDGIFRGYPWHYVKIPHAWQHGGQTFFFRIRSTHTNIGLGPTRFGDLLSLTLDNTRRDLIPIGIATILMFLGIATGIIALLRHSERSFTTFAAFSFTCGFMLLPRLPTALLVWNNPATLMTLAILCLYAIVGLFALMMNTFFGADRWNVSIWFARICFFYTAVVAILAFTESFPILKTLLPMQFFILFSIALFTFRLMKEIRLGNREALTIGCGFIFLLVGCVLDVMQSMRILSNVFESSSAIGMMLFVFSAAGVLGFRIQHLYRENENQAVMLEKKNVELTKLDKLKDEFLANTSHELRTPLHGIVGLAQALQNGIAGPVNEEQIHNLRLIEHSGSRLSSMVNDILDFSKLRDHALSLKPAAFSLEEAAATVVGLQQPVAARKKIELKVVAPDNLTPVWADTDRTQQILHNLVANALKFTHYGTVQVILTPKGDHLEVRVSDTGIGISPENLEKIFVAFEQVDGSAERAYGGTGLGLSLSKRMVEMHGATLQVESKLGIGSSFFFLLPFAKGEQLQQQKAVRTVTLSDEMDPKELTLPPVITATRSDDGKPKQTVLMVDDDEVNLQVLRNFLSPEGFDILAATSGKQAQEMIQQHGKPDIALVDVMMPEMSGYELTRQLRKRWAMSDLPIIFLTAKGQTKDVVHGFEAGGNDYLVKPVAQRELLVRTKIQLELNNSHEALRTVVEATQTATRQSELDLIVPTITSFLAAHMKIKGEVHASLFLFSNHKWLEISRGISFTLAPLVPGNTRQIPLTQHHTLTEHSDMGGDVSITTALPRTEPSESIIKQGSSLFLKLNGHDGLIGLLSLDRVRLNEFTQYDTIFLDSITYSLAILLESIKFREALVEAQIQVRQAKLVELGRVAIRLGDRMNNPLQKISLAAEEIEDVQVTLNNKEASESIKSNMSLIYSAIESIKSELGSLNRYKEFAPSNTLDEIRKEESQKQETR